ncbi:T9SS C-terminal target domain-containing protein [candidate division KSB1 bacterium]|nr:T9SS type A sorting domain-containing protein [candidate division KSB1 bacterium]RQW06828.1 MAG: T9SS C-terminal target domain-containing protein [candidate division KSB1 bacterium]
MKSLTAICFAFLFFLALNALHAQRWPADPAGDPAAEKIGWMEGNNVRVQFRNTTELSDWGTGTDPFAHKWPNDYRGSKLTDGIALLVGVRVFVENGSVPVTDLAEIQTRTDLDTIYFCQTSYREEQDTDPTGQVEWNFYPPRGYANHSQPDAPPAMSSYPESWPPAGWPTKGFEKAGAGYWFGRGGFNSFNADNECFFVVNDAQDQEYLQESSPVKYSPRPGHYIGDLDPHMSVQIGRPWGGAGLRVAVRGYQWNNYLAQDIIFWEYAVGNISDYDIPDAAVGFWVDSGLGEDSSDDVASTNAIDMVYLWDIDGIDSSGLQTPCIGYVYLETPGRPLDGIDNDSDGLIDEKRDNQSTQIIGPTDGIANLQNFLSYYYLEESDLRDHWDADEDQDWRDGYDTNANGLYDQNEFAGDDIGLDGKGPNDIGYPGPDAGECNHKPDYVVGEGCEPNFALLDVNESDMTGVNSFRLFLPAPHIPPYNLWFRNDASMWELLGESNIVPYTGSPANLILTFATGPFRLNKDEEIHVSIAELHSFDPIEGFNLTPTVTPVVAPQLHQQKITAQLIMDADYTMEFPHPSPPAWPTVQARFEDNSIIVSWDTNAEVNTKEPLLDNRNDFEGYKLFKRYSLDQFGNTWSEKELLLQCDVKDGITGTFHAAGIDYYLGNDSGLQHEYRDSDLYDGVLYEYLLVAYDYGLAADSIKTPGVPRISFPPAESMGGAQIAVPYPYAIKDFPWQKVSESFVGSGSVVPEIVHTAEVKSKHKYVVKFQNNIIRAIRSTNIGLHYVADGLSVYDITENDRRLVFEDTGEQPGSIVEDHSADLGYNCIKVGEDILTGSFEGIRLKLQSEVFEAGPALLNSGWLVGNAPISVIYAQNTSTADVYFFPWDLDILFSADPNAFVSQLDLGPAIRIYDENYVRLRDGLLGKQAFPFFVRNTTFGDSFDGEPVTIEMVVQDMDLDGQFSLLKDRVLVGYLDTLGRWAATVLVIELSAATSEDQLPKPGDVYQAKFIRPFWQQDSLVFIVDPEGTFIQEKDALPTEMRLSANYPNPFNPATTIVYSISQRVHVTLVVYNILGQRVNTLADKVHEPGHYKVQFDGKQLPSGLYFVALQAGDFSARRKMTLIR